MVEIIFCLRRQKQNLYFSYFFCSYIICDLILFPGGGEVGVVLFCFLFLFCFLLLLCPLKKKRRLIRVCKLQINRPTPVPKGKNASISCSDLFPIVLLNNKKLVARWKLFVRGYVYSKQQVLLPSDTEGTDGWIDWWTVGRTYK